MSGSIELWHEAHGAGEPPLVLVHGFTGSHRDWAGVVDELAAGRRVITLDHRGHGLSPNTGAPPTYRFEVLTDDLERLVDELAPGPFDLLGHSMGGVVAMRYALRHPGRLRSLVLMDTAGAPASDRVGGWMQAGIDTVRDGGMAALAERMEAFLPDADRARVRWSLEQMDPVAFVELAEELHRYPSMLEELAHLDLATTVVVGEGDAGLRPAADALASTIPGAVFELIPDAAHSPQLENREEWVRAVTSHLRRLRAD
jgi:pimeloyl-ACP methyl ester carboxylesterase